MIPIRKPEPGLVGTIVRVFPEQNAGCRECDPIGILPLSSFVSAQGWGGGLKTWETAAMERFTACPVWFNMVGNAAMKQYVIDELNAQERQAVAAHLERHAQSSGVDGLYWLPIGEDLLAPEQQAHHDCKPFAFALELLPDRLVCELLVRTRSRVRCSCIAYATPEQRSWLMDTIDAIFPALGIKV